VVKRIRAHPKNRVKSFAWENIRQFFDYILNTIFHFSSSDGIYVYLNVKKQIPDIILVSEIFSWLDTVIKSNILDFHSFNEDLDESKDSHETNEALKLHKSIPLFFQQEYPQYQIVVVNDCSVDESTDILEEFQKKYANLHVVELNEDDIKAHDKKLALTLGIKGAKYEHLLLTDADCVPGDNQWMACMARNYRNDKEVVIGYGPYKKTSGFLNKLIRFDAFFIGLQYLSFSLAGKTYMGVGRNLAYTKTLFFRHTKCENVKTKF
jgi:hypothetical protein